MAETKASRFAFFQLVLWDWYSLGAFFTSLAIVLFFIATGGMTLACACASEPISDNIRQQSEMTDVVEVVLPGQGMQRLHGVIVDITGEGLILQLADNSTRRIPCDQLVRFETKYSRSYSESQRVLTEGRVGEAIQLLVQARAEDSRLWVRRGITAQIVRLLHAREQYAEAASEFLTADFAFDCRSPFWCCIPLVWFPEMNLSRSIQEANSWLNSNDSVRQLLGASFLLDGPRQVQAVSVLEKLRLSPDRVIALLAAAQLWRREVRTAQKTTIAEWEKAIEGLPRELRAGPCYVIATAWQAQGDTEKALLAYLRPPILWPESRRVAARCLWEAASLATREEQRQENEETALQRRARALYRELATRYPESPWAGQVPKTN